MRRWAKRLVTYPLLAVAAVLLLVEEALWRLAKIYAVLGKLPVFRQIERWITSLGPYPALFLFAVPSITLAPVKFLALYWLAGGHPILGVSTIFTAKILGTALVARLFQLTKPSLLSIAWFRWTHDKIVQLRAAAYGVWQNSAPGRLFKKLKERFKRYREWNRGWLSRRWQAARLRIRKAN